ncbi:hypothetical protein D1614_01260 [Maribellus luteus]|uniref:Uncharacterized protein n=1 Tax=Maribellus luteus TaxID=2305463 RepID=A0A399T6H1_9BACT|nr:hypothetical protein D1614_01260 [Maribellus luteus]
MYNVLMKLYIVLLKFYNAHLNLYIGFLNVNNLHLKMYNVFMNLYIVLLKLYNAHLNVHKAYSKLNTSLIEVEHSHKPRISGHRNAEACEYLCRQKLIAETGTVN